MINEKNLQNANKNRDEKDFRLDFATSSALGQVNSRFIFVYLLIFWIGGFGAIIVFYMYFEALVIAFKFISENLFGFILIIVIFPFEAFIIYVVFVFGVLICCKVFLIIINLVHLPKEGIFLAERQNKDYCYWSLRIAIKKIGLWLTRNSPIPFIDAWAFRWFGIKMDFSSSLYDAWVDPEFIQIGRKGLVGQGSIIFSANIVGKYLIIKQVFLDDYVVIGGHATISPGTFIGSDSVVGALSTTNFMQVLKEGWIYFGIPAIELKPNKFAESRKPIIKIVDVDGLRKYKKNHEINIDEDKKGLATNNGGKLE
ncbi:MAG: hypothetical protein JW891_09240 [Candidatus Lokiarchaeota archaeon]|nr:hypothetical protein [Candidatus Lokiarchaeota archaeon]